MNKDIKIDRQFVDDVSKIVQHKLIERDTAKGLK